MFSKIIEQKINDLLDNLQIKIVPVPVEEIAEKHGIKIGRAPSKEYSGFMLRKAELAFIGINSNDSQQRQRFTIAHELGHYLLHFKKKAFVDYPENSAEIIFRDNLYKTTTVRNRTEIEANKFAAALLMPSRELAKDFNLMRKEELLPIEEKISYLADKYKVSKEAMTYRLIDLKLSD